jgi:hypothetical protein
MVEIFVDSNMPRLLYAGIHVVAGWLVKLEVEIKIFVRWDLVAITRGEAHSACL